MVNIIVSCVDALIATSFLIIKLQYNKDEKFPFLLFVIVQWIIAFALENVIVIQTILQIAVNIIFSIKYLKGRLFDKIIWSIATFFPVYIMSPVVMILFSIVTSDSVEQLVAGNIVSVIMLAILTRTAWLLCYFIMLKKQFKELNLKKTEWCIIVILFSITLLLMSELINIDFNMGISGIEQIGLLVVEILLVVILGCCVTLCIKIDTVNTKLIEKEQLLIKQESQKEMFEKAYKAQEETRIIRHDMKHFVNIWLKMLKAGEVEELQSSIEQFENEVSLSDTTVYYIKDNEIINYVLYEKLKKCKENNIKYDVEITTCFAKNVEMDISIIIANLIDNAIQSSVKQPLEERYISVQMFKRLDINNIIISNKISQSVLEANPKLMTTSLDKQRHGYGIKSVKKLVEKYNGDIDIVEENDCFVVHIIGL